MRCGREYTPHVKAAMKSTSLSRCSCRSCEDNESRRTGPRATPIQQLAMSINGLCYSFPTATAIVPSLSYDRDRSFVDGDKCVRYSVPRLSRPLFSVHALGLSVSAPWTTATYLISLAGLYLPATLHDQIRHSD